MPETSKTYRQRTLDILPYVGLASKLVIFTCGSLLLLTYVLAFYYPAQAPTLQSLDDPIIPPFVSQSDTPRNLTTDIQYCNDHSLHYHHYLPPKSYCATSIADNLLHLLPRPKRSKWFWWSKTSAGLDTARLTPIQEEGLKRWYKCSLSPTNTTFSSTPAPFDLPCAFEAFDLIFFAALFRRHSIPLIWVPYSPSLTFRGLTSHHRNGSTDIKIRLPPPQRPTQNATITELWAYRHGQTPSIISTLLHEMIHATFEIYSCPGQLCCPAPPPFPKSTQPKHGSLLPHARTVGLTGHGPAFQTLALALDFLLYPALLGRPEEEWEQWELYTVGYSFRKELQELLLEWDEDEEWPFEMWGGLWAWFREVRGELPQFYTRARRGGGWAGAINRIDFGPFFLVLCCLYGWNWTFWGFFGFLGVAGAVDLTFLHRFCLIHVGLVVLGVLWKKVGQKLRERRRARA